MTVPRSETGLFVRFHSCKVLASCQTELPATLLLYITLVRFNLVVFMLGTFLGTEQQALCSGWNRVRHWCIPVRAHRRSSTVHSSFQPSTVGHSVGQVLQRVRGATGVTLLFKQHQITVACLDFCVCQFPRTKQEPESPAGRRYAE